MRILVLLFILVFNINNASAKDNTINISKSEILDCMKEKQQKALSFSKGIIGYNLDAKYTFQGINKFRATGEKKPYYKTYHYHSLLENVGRIAITDDFRKNNNICEVLFSTFSYDLLSLNYGDDGRLGFAQSFKNWIIYLQSNHTDKYTLKDYNDKYVYFSQISNLTTRLIIPKQNIKSCDSEDKSDNIKITLSHCVFKNNSGKEFKTNFFLIKGIDSYKIDNKDSLEYEAMILEPVEID